MWVRSNRWESWAVSYATVDSYATVGPRRGSRVARVPIFRNLSAQTASVPRKAQEVSHAAEFENRLAETWAPLDWGSVTVLLSVSGGADSVALLRAMAALRTAQQANQPGRLVVAHFNHQLRGDASDTDETFVAELARELGLPCEVQRGDPTQLEASGGDGLEAAARHARYDFLGKMAQKWGARYVATGHTADDQAETILHRIVRGTGIGGLAGMARARTLGSAATLIRPLLGFRRAEIIAYLDDLGQSYRTDESNVDTRFTRNRIRHDLLPQLAEQYNPAVVDALLRLGTLAAESQEVIDRLVDDLHTRCVAQPHGEAFRVEIDATALRDRPIYVVRELLLAIWREQGWPLQSMGFTQWDLLAEMLLAPDEEDAASPPRKKMFPGGIVAERQGDTLVLWRG